MRHLRDRGREGESAFPFRFDLARAERFFRFASKLKHYKGEWAGRLIVLEPHQKFRLGSIFGWLHAASGLRRFRTAYNEIPRKNGKSLEAAIVALYVSFFDGEAGAEGYCVATKRQQAKIVHDDAKELVRSSGLRSRLKVQVGNINRADTSSKLEPLGADYDSTDGLNPNIVIVDEFHAMKTRGLIDVMETATGARRQALLFEITTAGDDPISPCGDQHDYACKILERVFDDETFFAFIAHADVDDDWTLEPTWKKANPNYGVSVKPDDLRAKVTKAIHMPSAAPDVKQKHLNLWVNTSTPWLSLDGWRAGQTTWTHESMYGEPCWVGVDLSSKTDLTAVVLLFPPTLTRLRWRIIAWCLTPEATLPVRERRDRAPYAKWVQLGYLATNAGDRIDQDRVREKVNAFAALYDVQEVGIDPWNAGNLVSDLETDGFRVTEIDQNKAQLSAPSKEFEADVLAALVDAGHNELVGWCVSNVVVKQDDNENIQPSKKRSRGRIDPVVAAIMARKLAAAAAEPAEDPQLVTT